MAWAEERDRQFREEVPVFREVDLHQRAIRIMARLRGMPTPPAEERWDDDGAARFSDPDEIDTVVEAYSRAFVATMPPVVGAGEVLAALAARGFRLAILSNWPLAATVDRYAASAGWDRHLVGIFVSQRIGTIKPHPAIFAFAADALGHAPHEILHVGDDWAADVVGARNAGWRVAYLRDHQADTPLPVSSRTAEIVPDLDLERLADLPSRITDPTA
jgi:HAD superfamily hydrolase (TIGR01509 family)